METVGKSERTPLPVGHATKIDSKQPTSHAISLHTRAATVRQMTENVSQWLMPVLIEHIIICRAQSNVSRKFVGEEKKKY